MTAPTLFLDIDGVLLSGRAWMLPSNRLLKERAADLPRRQALDLLGRDATFDACAVALVGQVCAATGARIVVSSSWRYTVGLDGTRSKLLDQGIPADLLHPDWACPMIRHGSPSKSVDVSNWLEEHGIQRHGTWLVLDDEAHVVPGATLRTDTLEGLGVRDAAAAVRYLGRTDDALGVEELPEDDIERVLRAFGGEWIEACRWLQGADAAGARRHWPSALLARGGRGEAMQRLELAAAEHAARRREMDQALNVLLGQGEARKDETP